MNFNTFIRPYVNFFFWLGQTPYPLDKYLCEKRDAHSNWHEVIFKIPTIFVFIVNFTLCVASIFLINISPYLDRSFNISIGVFLFCDLFKVFTVLHQNLALKEKMGAILRRFQSVEIIFHSKLLHPILFTAFERTYKRKLFWAFGSGLFLMIVVAIHRTILGKIHFADVMTEVIRFISIALYMHILLFIDLLTFYLKHLNATITCNNRGYDADGEYVFLRKKARKARSIQKQLSKYSMVFFRLWNITEELNEYFGWTLLAIMMLSFDDFVISVIWQLKVLNDFSRFMRLTRKNFIQSN